MSSPNYNMFAAVVGFLFASVPVALVLSLVMIGWYRRRVLRLMRAVKSVAVQPSSESPTVSTNADKSTLRDGAAALHAAMRRRSSRATIALAAGILAFALWSGATMLAASGRPFSPVVLIELFVPFAWPLIPLLAVATSARRRRVAAMTGMYLLVLLISGLISAPHYKLGPLLGFAAPFKVWLANEALPTLAILAMLQHRVRAISAMIFGAVALWLLGPIFAMGILAEHQAAASKFAWSAGLSAAGLIWVTIAFGLALGTAILAPLLGVLRRSYVGKHIGEHNLQVHPLLVVFALFHAGLLVFSGTRWVPVTLCGLGAYAAVSSLVARCLFRRATSDATQPPRLLYLRVFVGGSVRERFFRAWSGRWRHVGTIRLLTGPDLAAAVVEPPAFLDFVTGCLAGRFIDGKATLDRALETEDLRPDPDGRYRVSNFFCHHDTWQMTFSRLAEDSDVALMDLRGFTAQREGTSYELKYLASRMRAERIVLIADGTTDLGRVAELVRAGAREANRAGEPTIVRFDHDGRNDISDVVSKLCEAACLPANAALAKATA